MRYMIGLGLGTLLAFFFFGNRSCMSWLPDAKVREFLIQPGLVGDDQTRCLIRCGALDMNDIMALLEQGKIKYGESVVRVEEGTRGEKFYRIEDAKLSADFIVTDSVTTIRAVDLPAGTDLYGCDCN